MTGPEILDALRGPRRAGIERRFWRHLGKRGPDECWEWTGTRLPGGYGQMNVAGTAAAAVHRISFAIAFGWIPEAVMHKCDNPPCANPRHLFGGTQALNMADAARKWRMHGKVTPAVKSAILALSECGMSQRQVGRQVGVSHTTVYRIVNGKSRTAPAPVSA